MSRTLRIRLRAELDLDEIVEWIAQRDERAALRFQDRVRETLDRVARFPELASAVTTNRGRQVRICPVKRYRRFVVIYRLTQLEVEVIRIVRGSRNLDQLLDG